MALEFAHGAIRWLAADAAAVTYTVSGLAFQPKAIRFYWVGLDSAGTDVNSSSVDCQRGVGFATSTSERRSVSSYDDTGVGTSDCATVAASDCVAGQLDNTGARVGELDLNAINSDGFQLIVDDQGVVNLTIFWEAWGGSDITVAVCGDLSEPASPGDVSPTATGLTSDGGQQVVMFAGVQSTAAVNTSTVEASGLCVGFATATAAAEQVVVTGNADHASTTTDTDGFCQSGKCITQIVLAGGNATSSAALSAWGTNAFTVTFAGTMVSARKTIWLAIKGGYWRAGEYTIAGNSASATATVSGTVFVPIGVCIIGRMSVEQGTTVSDVNDRIGMGTGTSTSSRRSMGILNENATVSSNVEVDTTIQYDQVLCFPSDAGGLQSAYDIDAMNSDGFRIIVDTAGGVASEWQGYLTFGNVLPPSAPLVMAPYRSWGLR